MIVVVVEMVVVLSIVDVWVTVCVVENESVVDTLGGTTVDVDVAVTMEVTVEVGVRAVVVDVCLTAMIFFVYVIWTYLLPRLMSILQSLGKWKMLTCNRLRVACVLISVETVLSGGLSPHQ